MSPQRTSLALLDGNVKHRAQECLLGNFMADAMLEYRRNISDTVGFALINSSGIRATIDQGPFTRGEVLTSFPFSNQIVKSSLKGEDLWKSIKGVYSEKSLYNERVVTSKVQVSTGINITYDSKPTNGTHLVSL
jgi:2',3'-cyclic-nucleotide 2'-phosphodiesterase (5'-nucleotidase family)